MIFIVFIFEHKIKGFFSLDKTRSNLGKSIEFKVLKINLKVCKEKEKFHGLKQE